MRWPLLLPIALLCLGSLIAALPQRGGGGGGGRGTPPKPAPPPPVQEGGRGGPVQGPGAGRRGEAPAPAPSGRETAAAIEDQMHLAELYFAIADYDGDGVISWREARESLRMDKHRFEVVDTDGDALIQLEEFRASFRRTLESQGSYPPPLPEAGSEGALRLEPAEPTPGLWPERPAASVLELFGTHLEREDTLSVVPLPAQVLGPVDAFHRLDTDRDGGISEEDLDTLQRPVQLLVRRSTVLANLDTNGDGVIDRAEFYASMRGTR